VLVSAVLVRETVQYAEAEAGAEGDRRVTDADLQFGTILGRATYGDRR
jgi:hypothetical protein